VKPTPAASHLERLYKGGFGKDPLRTLSQFGYSTFRGVRSLEAPGPVPPGYRLGPGDEVVVTVTGSLSLVERSTVDRDGQVILPVIGSLPVANRTFGELHEVLTAAFGTRYRGFALQVSLGRLRTIRVQILGQVKRPGPLDVPARVSLASALSAAGGVLKTGSLRRVRLTRAGARKPDLDLYEYLLGSGKAELVLQPGDVIRVPPIGQTVGVAGYVRRPGIYELLGTETVGQVLELAAGLTPFAFTPHLQIETTVEGRGRTTLDVELDTAGKTRRMKDGELILVGAVESSLQPLVRIEGEVVRTGNYELRKGTRVSDMVRRADGLTVDAYLQQALISRQSVQVTGGSYTPDPKRPNISRQVLVVDLGKALRGDPEHDLPLHPLDLLTIRSRRSASVLPVVQISGAIKHPGSYEVTEGMRASDLVAIAGNLLANAFPEKAELVRRVRSPSGLGLDAKRFHLDLVNAIAKGQGDPVLRDGDQVIVRALRPAHISVEIAGVVAFPGRYTFPAGARITDLLAAGGLLPGSDLGASVFTRRSVGKSHRETLAHLTSRTRHSQQTALEDMALTGQSQEALAQKLSLRHSSEILKRRGGQLTSGRIVIPFLREDFPSSPYNLHLEPGDVLRVKQRQETVSVVGMVFNPSTFVAEGKLTIEDVLDRAGGLLEDGDEDRIYVMRADGVVHALDQGKNPLEEDDVLLPGDVVLVPRRPLERSVRAQVEDGLSLARQLAETALTASQVASPASAISLSSEAPTTGRSAPVSLDPLFDSPQSD
jgi:protein involved in polysaccharide export with SLBB domain